VSGYSAPTDNQSIPQIAHRSGMHNARDAWRALTQPERDAWNLQAKGLRGVSGYNLYVKQYLENYYGEIKSPFDSIEFDNKNFC
jgi:hypothetical protein